MNRLNLILGLILAPSFALQSQANDSVREAIEKAIPYVQRQGAWWIDEKACVSCHRVGQMLWSLNTARSKGLTVSSRLDEWTSWAIDKSLSKHDDGQLHGERNKDGLAQLLLARNRTIDKYDAQHEQFAKLIAIGQEEDGTWKPGGQLPGQKRDKLETTNVGTAWIAVALFDYRESADVKASFNRAIKHLNSVNSAKSAEWFVARLLLAVKQKDATEIEAMINRLMATQNDDGGWGWILNQESDALATGMVLYALNQSGVNPKQERISKAVEFLTSSQNDDGSWDVKGTKNAKKDHVEETSTYWGTTWAVIALLEFVADPS